MSGDDEQDTKRLDRVALPPPKKRRDPNLRMLFPILSSIFYRVLFSFSVD